MYNFTFSITNIPNTYAGFGVFGFNGKEKDDEIKGNGNSLDFGARIYDPRVGRWLACDPLASKYPSLSPYQFCANNPIIFIDNDGKLIIALNEDAKQVITNSLTPEDAKFVKFDDKGNLDQTLLSKATSNSVNLCKLQQLSNDKHIYEVIVDDKFNYKNEKGEIVNEKMPATYVDKSEGTGLYGSSTGEQGFGGVTQTPGDEPNKYNSTNENTTIVINKSLSEQGKAEIFAHEAYGHAYLYSIGQAFKHIFVKSEKGGQTEGNIELKESIQESQKEVIENYEKKGK